MKAHNWVYNALNQCGIRAEKPVVKSVSGGDISEAYKVVSDGKSYFIKTNEGTPVHFFETEGRSLNLLSQVPGVKTPHIYGIFSVEEKQRSGLVMEWITPSDQKRHEKYLGESLAALHTYTGSEFGFESDTYIGKYPLKNDYCNNWCNFFRSFRLEPQWEISRKKGLLNKEENYKMEILLSNLDQWLPGSEIKPVLLHGDFWAGNWLAGTENKVYLIDPSICYGHHELDLAFSELFGGFSPPFYQSYKRLIKIEHDYYERKPIYQLFYLLVHLNMFGLSYKRKVMEVLNRYT